MDECIRNCTDCHRVCKETMLHCLSMGGEHAEQSHIKTLLECAEACNMSAGFMILRSDLHPDACDLCAEACERCAESCERIGQADEHMKACAEICRRCAASCERMSD